MFRQLFVLLLIVFVAVNAGIRNKRQFGPGGYNRGGGNTLYSPSYRPSLGGGGGFGRDRGFGHHQGGRPEIRKTVITEVVRGK